VPDYARTARLLRAKAADPVVPDAERQALLEKAQDLETRYSNGKPSTINDTTVTSHDGRSYRPEPQSWYSQHRYSQQVLFDLLKNQWQWNTEYYDRNGTPKPAGPTADDLYEETYKYADNDPEDEDEDYGYDLFEGEDYA
jgi:hypothetical protein